MGRVHIVQPVVENSSARFPDDCSCSVPEKFHLMADHFEPPLHCLPGENLLAWRSTQKDAKDAKDEDDVCRTDEGELPMH